MNDLTPMKKRITILSMIDTSNSEPLIESLYSDVSVFVMSGVICLFLYMHTFASLQVPFTTAADIGSQFKS